MVQMFGIIKGLMVYSPAIVEYRWNHWRKKLFPTSFLVKKQSKLLRSKLWTLVWSYSDDLLKSWWKFLRSFWKLSLDSTWWDLNPIPPGSSWMQFYRSTGKLDSKARECAPEPAANLSSSWLLSNIERMSEPKVAPAVTSPARTVSSASKSLEKPRRARPEEFIFGKLIGEGSYSCVFLAKVGWVWEGHQVS